MSDNWEEFMEARTGIERKVYHFYWGMFKLYMIKDDEGNILAGTGPKTWDELRQNPGLQKARLMKVKRLVEVRDQARREKKEGTAQIVVHYIKKEAARFK